jgi:hypothetical protein
MTCHHHTINIQMLVVMNANEMASRRICTLATVMSVNLTYALNVKSRNTKRWEMIKFKLRLIWKVFIAMVVTEWTSGKVMHLDILFNVMDVQQ